MEEEEEEEGKKRRISSSPLLLLLLLDEDAPQFLQFQLLYLTLLILIQFIILRLLFLLHILTQRPFHLLLLLHPYHHLCSLQQLPYSNTLPLGVLNRRLLLILGPKSLLLSQSKGSPPLRCLIWILFQSTNCCMMR